MEIKHNTFTQKTLEKLDWGLVQDIILSRSLFPESNAQYLFNDLKDSELTDHYGLLKRYFSALVENEIETELDYIAKFSSEKVFVESFKKLPKEAILDIQHIHYLTLSIEFFLKTKWLRKLIFNEDSHIVPHSLIRISKEIRKFIDLSGFLDYQKHPLLKKLDHNLIEVEIKIRNFLSNIHNSEFADSLQYSGHDVINDHYVVPIKSDRYQSNFGRIISHSESGHTLYVEPSAIRELGFQRLEIKRELDATLYKIKTGLSIDLYQFKDELILYKDWLLLFDRLYTHHQFATTYDLTEPAVRQTPGFSIHNMFHPLIEKPVKNSIEVNKDHKGLVISGPNTGGKTVTLKTTLICIILFKKGFYVPAESAELYPYQHIFYFGSDEQDLSMGLSSFAAEVTQYNDLVHQLGDSNIVVIDEIFNSTSSEEASALALAFFQYLTTRYQVHFLVSTHHQILKTAIHTDKSFISANMGFDDKTNLPTYKLHIGLPGSSMALSIYESLSAKNDYGQEILTLAKSHLDSNIFNYNHILEVISKKQSEIETTARQNRELNLQLKNQKASMEGVYKLKLKDKLASAEKKILDLVESAKELKRQSRNNTISQNKLYEAESRLKNEVSKLAPVTTKDDKQSYLKPAHDIQVGKSYFCKKVNNNVTIKSIKGEQVEAFRGSFKIKCLKSDLYNNNQAHKTYAKKVSISFEMHEELSTRYDCRGLRLEEFESRLETIISNLILRRIPFASIIHGHGDGVLKRALNSKLKEFPQIKSDQSVEGNDGETRLKIS